MSQYMLIAIAVLVTLLAGAGWLLKQSYERNGALEIALQAQQAEMRKVEQQMAKLGAESAANARESEMLSMQMQDLEISKDREINALRNKIQSTVAAAAREPAQYGRVSTNLLRRGMRRACKATDGDGGACKVDLAKAPKAVAGTADGADAIRVERITPPSGSGDGQPAR